MPRLQARSRQRLRLFALGTWSNVPSPVPIWRANERARESVSPRERERERERKRVGPGPSQSDKDARYTFNTGDIRVCLSSTHLLHSAVSLLYPEHIPLFAAAAAWKGEADSANCPPANCPGIVAERSTLTRYYDKARSEPLHYNCIVVHTTPASSDKTGRPDCPRPLSLHLGKHLPTWRIDDVYPEGGTTCTPQSPPRRSAALIAKTHTQAYQTSNITPALPQLSLSSFARLSHPDRLATSILFGKQEHARHRQFTV